MEKSIEELLKENSMLRREIKVAREAADITARLVVKQFEKTEHMLHRFQTANAQRQAVLNAATQLSIIATDLEGDITLFNLGATNLLGFTESEMVERCNIASIHLKDELRRYGHELTGMEFSEPDAANIFDLHVKQRISQSSEWTYLCKDGTHLPVNLSITPFYNARGLMTGYLFTAMDIGRQKQMEQELIQAIKSAEAANASKGDFLARMSHEIRTPMNGILGMALLMRKTDLSEKQHNYLDKVLSSANTLLGLINDILDFSKIDAGKLELEAIEFDLDDVLANLVSAIGIQADKKGLEFLFQVDPDVPCKFIGDPLRLGQILMNLAGNAVKFTESGEIVISITLDRGEGYQGEEEEPSFPLDQVEGVLSENNEITLEFSVKDSGVGLHPQQIEDLFEPFSQADDTITRKYGGTGLGLSICRQLTDMMGGKIWVNSAPGQGSTFTFTVTLKCPHLSITHRLPCGDILRGRRALVVDDNRAVRKLLVDMLRSFKMEVDDAVDGKTALLHLKNALETGRPYDVVLLDWIMPGMDGIETARCIKANAAMAATPAMLMVTANGREEARVEAEKAGCSAFLMKPVYSSLMYNTLLQTLGIDSLAHGERRLNTANDLDPLEILQGIQGARILLVEDNPINQEVALGFLRDAGMEVSIANNGREALNIIETDMFDLVFMDIQMPVMDGLEATRIIRNEKKISHLPIIAMTAHAMAGDREKSLKAGMDGHLNKPVEPAMLYQLLQKFIPEKKGIRKSTKIQEKDIPPTPEEISRELKENQVLEEKAAPISPLQDSMPLIPPLKGINQVEALKRLNNNPDMLLSILNDFKKDYSELPDTLRQLLSGKNFQEIRIVAHTIKGVSSYMGADALCSSASSLEIHLINIQNQSKKSDAPDFHHEDVDTRLVLLFIDEIEALLKALKQLPTYRKKNQVEKKEEDGVTSLEQIYDKKSPDEKDQRILHGFTALLAKGELSSADLLSDVELILKKYGFEKELNIVMELIDDFEYEDAAKKIEDLL